MIGVISPLCPSVLGLDITYKALRTRRPEIAGFACAGRCSAPGSPGRRLGVTGTPTLFINGRPMPGALPFDFLKTAIEAQLDLARAGE